MYYVLSKTTFSAQLKLAIEPSGHTSGSKCHRKASFYCVPALQSRCLNSGTSKLQWIANDVHLVCCCMYSVAYICTVHSMFHFMARAQRAAQKRVQKSSKQANGRECHGRGQTSHMRSHSHPTLPCNVHIDFVNSLYTFENLDKWTFSTIFTDLWVYF